MMPPAGDNERVQPGGAAESQHWISTDARCRACGYLLRGLNPYGLCPECATPVQLSLGGDDLYLTSLAWLRSLRRGFGLMKLALALCLFVALVVLVLGAFSARSIGRPGGPPNSLAWLDTLLLIVVTVALAAAFICGPIGFILATRAEPLARAIGEGFSARRAVRSLVIIAALLGVAIRGIREFVPPSSVTDVLMMVLPHCMSLALLFAALAFARYAICLLKRTPQTKPLKSAEQIVGVASIGLLLTGIGIAGRAVLPALGTSAPRLAEVLGDLVRLAEVSHCCAVIVVIGLFSLVWRVSGVLAGTLTMAEDHARKLAEKSSRT